MPEAIEQAQSLFDSLVAQAKATQKSPDPDAVHDLRVAIRRFTQSLVIYQDVFRARDAAKLRKRLKAVLRLAGAVRDFDITGKLVSKKAAAAAAVHQNLLRRRTVAVRELKAGIRKWLLRRDSLPVTGHPPAIRVAEIAAARLAKDVRDFFSKGKDVASAGQSARNLHRFRIEAKKFRYTLELFQPVYGDAVETRLENMRDLQTALGDINDCRAANALLKEIGADDSLRQAVKKKQRKRLEDFHKVWDERFAPPETRRDWLQAFHLAAPKSRKVAQAAAAAVP